MFIFLHLYESVSLYVSLYSVCMVFCVSVSLSVLLYFYMPVCLSVCFQVLLAAAVETLKEGKKFEIKHTLVNCILELMLFHSYFFQFVTKLVERKRISFS